jgi:hypothetical protein
MHKLCKMTNRLTVTIKDRGQTLLMMQTKTPRVWVMNSKHWHHRNSSHKELSKNKIHRKAPKIPMRFCLIRLPKQPWPSALRVDCRMTNSTSCSKEFKHCSWQPRSPNHFKTVSFTRPNSMAKTCMISRWPGSSTDCCEHRRLWSAE